MRTAARRSLLLVVATVALLVAVALLPARNLGGGEPPAQAETLPVGASSLTVSVGDLQPDYRAYRTAELPAEAPLVLMLHGGGGSATQAEAMFGWTTLAEREGFVVVHPEGLHRSWNSEGGCCGRAAAQDVDDVAFLTRMVEDLSSRVTVDPDRVFVTDMSNGAMRSNTLACGTDVFAAVDGPPIDDVIEFWRIVDGCLARRRSCPGRCGAR